MSAFQIFTQPSQQALDTAANVLSGATLTFTLTGTNTPTNAYTDSTLTTPLANPLAANSAGVWVPIFLDPTVQYRIVLKTAGGSVLQTWDPANENVIGYFTQAIIGALLYPRTSAESTAGVTPTNYAYPSLDARRYGYVADNNTASASTNVTALNSAISVAAATVANGTGATVVLPTGTAYINATITLPNRVRIGGQNCSGTIVKAASPFSTPTVPFMLYALNGTNSMFDSILQDLTIDCSDIASLGCVKSIAWQENSGLRSVLLFQFRTYGFLYENAWGGASTLELQQCQFFPSNLGATACIYVNLLPVTSSGAFLLHVCDSVLAANIQGTILTLNNLVGGAAYTNGTYTNVPLTGGTGTQAHATVVVSGGAVTSVTITSFGSFPGGIGYVVGDTLSAAAADIGGTGAGFSIKVATIANNATYGIQIGGSALLCDNCHFEGVTDGIYADTSGAITCINMTGIAGMTNLVHLAGTFTGYLNMIGCRRNGSGMNLLKNDVTGEIFGIDLASYVYPSISAQNAAKAWCSFNGTTAGTNAPTAGLNVTSVQRISAGRYKINLSVPVQNLNMAPVGSSNANNAIVWTQLVNVSSFNVNIDVGGVATDASEVKAIAFAL